MSWGVVSTDAVELELIVLLSGNENAGVVDTRRRLRVGKGRNIKTGMTSLIGNFTTEAMNRVLYLQPVAC